MFINEIAYEATVKRLPRIKALVDSKQLRLHEACLILGISPHLYHKYCKAYEKSLQQAELKRLNSKRGRKKATVEVAKESGEQDGKKD